MPAGTMRAAVLGTAKSSLLTLLSADWELQEVSGTRTDVISANNLAANGTGGVGQTTGPGNGLPKAASFVAANSQFLSKADFAAVQLGGVHSTISAWANPTNNAATYVIISKWNGTGNEYSFFFNTSGKLGIQCGATTKLSTGTVPTGSFSLVSAVFDVNAGTVSLYINGALDSTQTLSITNSNGAFNIGANAGASGFFSGAIAGARIWKGVKLSTAQILGLNSMAAYPFYGIP